MTDRLQVLENRIAALEVQVQELRKRHRFRKCKAPTYEDMRTIARACLDSARTNCDTSPSRRERPR